MAPIAIIGGTGALGRALALRLARAGHAVRLGSRDAARAEATAAEVAAETGGRVVGAGYTGAAEGAEVCFLAVPYAAHAETLSALRGALAGKILVDTTAPLRPPKVGTVQLPAAGCAALEAASLLGEGVRVVSAFQTIGAEKLASGAAIDADVLVAADDDEAAETVRRLISDMGLRSWRIGPLANSAASEALTSVLIQVNRKHKLSQAGVRITGRPKEAPEGPAEVTAFPVVGLPLFAPGDDLAGAIVRALREAGRALADGDVVVVAQKAVSKVEGRIVTLSDVEPGPAARAAAAKAGKDPVYAELVLRESQELMRTAPGVIVARHRLGHVLANAGVDASNVSAEGGERAVLWPADPDASARALRAALEAWSGVRLAVIVSDSFGRAWRIGTTGTAIGSAGLRPVRDRRGESDLFGRELVSTVVGVADEIAAAASLVIGEAAEGTPVAVVRGAPYEPDDTAGIGEIVRPIEKDLFR
jgi:coenzyme F420-0:L-glutamate ligase/NADPH-dependent F420 reductase